MVAARVGRIAHISSALDVDEIFVHENVYQIAGEFSRAGSVEKGKDEIAEREAFAEKLPELLEEGRVAELFAYVKGPGGMTHGERSKALARLYDADPKDLEEIWGSMEAETSNCFAMNLSGYDGISTQPGHYPGIRMQKPRKGDGDILKQEIRSLVTGFISVNARKLGELRHELAELERK